MLTAMRACLCACLRAGPDGALRRLEKAGECLGEALAGSPPGLPPLDSGIAAGLVAVLAAGGEASAAAGIWAVLAALVGRGQPLTAALCDEVIQAADGDAVSRAAQFLGKAAMEGMEYAALQLADEQLLPGAAVSVQLPLGPQEGPGGVALLAGISRGREAAAAAGERGAAAAAPLAEEGAEGGKLLQREQSPEEHQRLARELGRKKNRRLSPESSQLLARSTSADRDAVVQAMNASEVSPAGR